MTKEQQDLAYGCLPKEVREEIKKEYQRCNCGSYIEDLLEDLFGHHNLTSDTEPSELVFTERVKLQEMFEIGDRSSCSTLAALFGDKCLPDKPSVQAEPKFKVGDIVENAFCDSEHLTIIEVIVTPNKVNFQYKVKEYPYLWNECELEPYTEPETKDNAQQNGWDEDFKKMNECFEKIQKTLSSLCDTFGKLEANVNKLNRL